MHQPPTVASSQGTQTNSPFEKGWQAEPDGVLGIPLKIRCGVPTWDVGRGSYDFSTPLKRGVGGVLSSNPVRVAALGSLNGILSSAIVQTIPSPTAADLISTVEVQFTPAILAKAKELGCNAVNIYNWVYNNIEYVPTYGSIQGADIANYAV